MPSPILEVPTECSGEIVIDQSFIAKRDALVEQAATINVVDQTSAEEAAAVLKEVTRLVNKSETMRLDLQRPFSDFVATIRDAVKKETQALHDTKKFLAAKTTTWVAAQRKIEEAERRKQQEEENRLAQEEAERQKEAEIFGGSITDDPAPVETVVYTPPVTTTVVAGMSLVESIDFTVESVASIPDAFKTQDDKKIKEWLKVNREKLLPQIKDYEAKHNAPFVVHGLTLSIKTSTRTR